MRPNRKTLPESYEGLHAIADDSRVVPVNMQFQITDTENGALAIEAATGPSGPIDFSIAYRLTIPKDKVYRITYHLHWQGHNRTYIGMYDEKRDNHLPMYQYSGGGGYGQREFTLPAQSEDLDYILHGHFAYGILGGHLPWKQVPAKLSTGASNTIVFTPYEPTDGPGGWNIGFLSWGVMTAG